MYVVRKEKGNWGKKEIENKVLEVAFTWDVSMQSYKLQHNNKT